MYPQLTVDLVKLQKNMQTITEKCRSYGIEVFGVTKVCGGSPEVGRALVAGGAVGLADSRLPNLMRLKEADLGVPLLLLRSPAPSEVGQAVEVADISVNSEKQVLLELNDAAALRGLVHQVLLMVDLGDLREGVWGSDLVGLYEFTQTLTNISIWGIGTNMACLSGESPQVADYEHLAELIRNLDRSSLNYPLMISGGNSSALHLMRLGHWRGPSTSIVNNLRIGESAFLGWDIIDQTPLPGCCQDVCQLVAEVIEVQTKPTDRGPRRRAILAIGRQDLGGGQIWPLWPRASVVGITSDHLVLDVEDVPGIFVGSLVPFAVDYNALLGLFTSQYVEKKHVFNIAVKESL